MLEAGIHSLRNLFWLVKDTFLSEIVSNNTINPTWRVFETIHQHKRIYHRGNIKLNVWWESYFYPRKLLFAAIKEITILFCTHWPKLWKSGEEDWQTRGVARIFWEVRTILQNCFALPYPPPPPLTPSPPRPIALYFPNCFAAPLQTVGYEQEFIEDKSKSKNRRKASA